jgi:hypothetical protein
METSGGEMRERLHMQQQHKSTKTKVGGGRKYKN